LPRLVERAGWLEFRLRLG
jgi:hypothetical protein